MCTFMEKIAQKAGFGFALVFFMAAAARAYNFSNVICNGDFQEYGMKPIAYVEAWKFVGSDYGCWYNKMGGVIQIKIKGTSVYPYLTTICQLVHTTRYTLCQSVSLMAHRLHQLSFTTFNIPSIPTSTILVHVNGNQIHNHTISLPVFVEETSTRFWTNQTNNQLCFDAVFLQNSANLYAGPCLDNVTLFRLGPDFQNYDLGCWLQLGHNWEVNIYCQYQQSAQIQYYLNLLSPKLKVTTPTLTLRHEILQLNQTHLILLLLPSPQYNAHKISLKIQMQGVQQELNLPVPVFVFRVEGLPVTVVNMEEGDTRAIGSIYGLAARVMTGLQAVYAVLRGCFLSYFLINIINFWNLSLMYNLLNISTIPMFCKQILQKLTTLFFNLNSLLEWAQDKDPTLKQTLNFSEIEGRQLLQQKKNNFKWFGSFGLSSNLLQNNFQTYVLIILLILKLSLLALLHFVPCLQPHLKTLFPYKKDIVKMLLLEIISMETFMVLSSTSVLMNFGYTGLRDKVNSCLQVASFWGVFGVVGLYFVVATQIRGRKYKRKKRKNKEEIKKKSDHYNHMSKSPNKPSGQKPSQQQWRSSQASQQPSQWGRSCEKSGVVTQVNSLLELVPIIVIPSSILVNNPLIFLSVTTIMLVGRIWWFCKYVGKFTDELDDKIFNGFNLGFWALLQLMYLGLYVLDKVIGDGGRSAGDPTGDDLGTLYYWIKVVGFAIVATVLIGGSFQIFRFLLQVLKALFLMTRYLMKVYRKAYKKQPKITPQTPQSHKSRQPQKSSIIQISNIRVAKKNMLANQEQQKKVTLFTETPSSNSDTKNKPHNPAKIKLKVKMKMDMNMRHNINTNMRMNNEREYLQPQLQVQPSAGLRLKKPNSRFGPAYRKQGH